jgi:tRNA threonylcarbamoyladenosine biosynthesis protein TsaB
LAIETATSTCSVALFDGDTIIAAVSESVGRGHAERLIPMIASLPGGGRAEVILAGCGPGSFTGIRIGLAAARGLALAWGGTAFGYSTLALTAATYFQTVQDITGDDDAVTIVNEAGHGEVFVQRFGRAPFTALSALASLTPEDAALHLKGATLAGSAAHKIAALVTVKSHTPSEADARFIMQLSQSDRNLAPSPIYGRAPDAKVPTG